MLEPNLKPSGRLQAVAVGLVLVLVCGCAGQRLSAVAPAGLDISGRWRLTVEDSDDISELSRQGPGPAGAEGQQRGQAGGAGVSEFDRFRAARHLAFRRPTILYLEQNDSAVVVRGDATFSLRLPTAGRGFGWTHHPSRSATGAAETPDVEVRTVAGWDDRSLIVVHEVAGGGKISRRYLPSPSNGQLFVVTTFAPRVGQRVHFRAVYDRERR